MTYDFDLLLRQLTQDVNRHTFDPHLPSKVEQWVQVVTDSELSQLKKNFEGYSTVQGRTGVMAGRCLAIVTGEEYRRQTTPEQWAEIRQKREERKARDASLSSSTRAYLDANTPWGLVTMYVRRKALSPLPLFAMTEGSRTLISAECYSVDGKVHYSCGRIMTDIVIPREGSAPLNHATQALGVNETSSGYTFITTATRTGRFIYNETITPVPQFEPLTSSAHNFARRLAELDEQGTKDIEQEPVPPPPRKTWLIEREKSRRRG